jgi:hypothetical protein
MRVTNGISLGWPLFLPVHTVNSVRTLKADLCYPTSFSLTINSVTTLMTSHNTEGRSVLSNNRAREWIVRASLCCVLCGLRFRCTVVWCGVVWCSFGCLLSHTRSSLLHVTPTGMPGTGPCIRLNGGMARSNQCMWRCLGCRCTGSSC